jgi:putative dehydrogenase
MNAVDAQLVDGAIIGAPLRGDDAEQTTYFLGIQAGEARENLAGLMNYGINVRFLEKPIGAASALKLSYVGIAKGLVALGTAAILAAGRAGTRAVLKAELAASRSFWRALRKHCLKCTRRHIVGRRRCARSLIL